MNFYKAALYSLAVAFATTVATESSAAVIGPGQAGQNVRAQAQARAASNRTASANRAAIQTRTPAAMNPGAARLSVTNTLNQQPHRPPQNNQGDGGSWTGNAPPEDWESEILSLGERVEDLEDSRSIHPTGVPAGELLTTAAGNANRNRLVGSGIHKDDVVLAAAAGPNTQGVLAANKGNIVTLVDGKIDPSLYEAGTTGIELPTIQEGIRHVLATSPEGVMGWTEEPDAPVGTNKHVLLADATGRRQWNRVVTAEDFDPSILED
ncbi:MAG: hypothetical protein FWD33_02845 [Alphaproteobacteria bacterium]|nr:hypothetical protein [Alphaproteobacteria bacterium]